METEIIPTEDKNIVIERTITEVEINIQAIKNSILENEKLANEFKIKKEKLEKFIEFNEDKSINEALREKIAEYEKLMVGFLMDKSKGELYLTNLLN